MSITLTNVAATKLNEFLKPRQEDSIRLLVKTMGCSGLGYHLEFVNRNMKGIPSNTSKDDIVINIGNINIIVDPKSYIYLKGTEIDYIKEGLNEGFSFSNPNSKAECGCGESFTV
jgi:iron-sulfur cluster assembly protein